MAEVLHKYVKTTVIREVTRVYSNGMITSFVAVDSNEPDRKSLAGTLVHATHLVINNGGRLDDALDLNNLPEITVEGDDE